jgi:hypothetical protein
MSASHRAALRLPTATWTPWAPAQRATPGEHLAALQRQRLSGYALFTGARSGGAALLQEGAPVRARWGSDSREELADGPALQALLRSAEPAVAWAQPLADDLLPAVGALFTAPQTRGRLEANPVEQFKELLRALAVLRQTGGVEVVTPGGWARALLVQGRVVGSYGAGDDLLRPTLAPCAAALQPGCEVLVYAAPADEFAPLALPEPEGSAERDEKIETDLVWLLSRHERVFTRVRERGARPGELFRALAALFSEFAVWHAAVAGPGAPDLAGRLAALGHAHPVVHELSVRGDALDGDDLARRAAALPPGPVAERFRREVALALLEGVRAAVSGVLEHVADPVTAARGRDAAAALLREAADVAINGKPVVA